MSANATDTPVQETAQTGAQPGVPTKLTSAQTVCNVKNEKGKLCNGHLKQQSTGGEGAEVHLRGDDVLFKCQACGALYMGPPLGHLRDPFKQQRFVELELSALLQAAGGTLPAIVKNERGVFVLAEEAAPHAPAAAKPVAAKAGAAPAAAGTAEKKAPAAAQPAAASADAQAARAALGPIPGADGPVPGETREEKLARLRAVVAEAKRRHELFGGSEGEAAAATGQTKPAAASTSGTDSSAQADAHRPAAEAQAATGQASAAPLSPAAATASPVAGAETPEELAPDTVNEKAAAPARRATPGGTLFRAEFDTGPVPGETREEKIERLKQVVAAAKARAEG